MNQVPPRPPVTTPPPLVSPLATAAAIVPSVLAPIPPSALNQAQVAKKASKAKEAAILMRQHLWPDVQDEELWLIGDKRKKGFTSMPRTLPILMNIIGDASKRVGPKSVPAGRAYLVLWCRVYGEALVKIENEMVAASEAGYTGERSVSTWREHLRVLKDLGFIDFRPGPAGPMHFVLLLNPYKVAKSLRAQQWASEIQYTALMARAMEIGAAPDLAD